ncbi:MAG: CorA family divalent cation transporter [Acholeplasmataceae bacterium]
MKLEKYYKPKTFVYTGAYQDVSTIVHHYQYSDKAYIENEELVENSNYKNYIQVVGLNDAAKLNKIQEMFNIEPFIMEDILNVGQRNKFEYKDEYVFTSFNVLYFDQNHQIQKDYMSMIYLGQTVITFHETQPYYLEPLIPLLKEYQELKSHSADLLFYHILDIITDGHLDVYDALDHQMTLFEEEILESKDMEQEAFYLVRKQMLQLKNIISPMYEQLDKMLQRKLSVFNIDHQSYFEDLKDHLQRLESKLHQARDMMRQLLDLHMNNQSTKMNQIMSTLTLFSAIFIPLSFLTGYFGMNFREFTALDQKYGVLIFSVMCIIIAIGMVLFFKKKKWL